MTGNNSSAVIIVVVLLSVEELHFHFLESIISHYQLIPSIVTLDNYSCGRLFLAPAKPINCPGNLGESSPRKRVTMGRH